ncbi:MAG: glycosyltransferase [Planctomycetota bacterium]
MDGTGSEAADGRITLVVPCWNAGRHLEPMLRSLLAQTEIGARLVLVDDGSTDGSADLARRIGGERLVVHVNERRLGIAGNWNRCAELVATPYFALAHMDDVYDPHWARALVDELERRPDAGAAHCIARAIDEDGRPIDAPQERVKLRFWRGLDGADRAQIYARLLRGNFVSSPTVVWRTAAFRGIGGFDPRFRFALDWCASFALLRSGATMVGVPRALVRYRRHAASATRTLERDLTRYREERDVADEARELGVAAGLLPTDAPRSRAARNHLLHDVLHDLESGDRDGANAKLRFAREELDSGDALVKLVGVAARAGLAGRLTLRLGFRALLALRDRT